MSSRWRGLILISGAEEVTATRQLTRSTVRQMLCGRLTGELCFLAMIYVTLKITDLGCNVKYDCVHCSSLSSVICMADFFLFYISMFLYRGLLGLRWEAIAHILPSVLFSGIFL